MTWHFVNAMIFESATHRVRKVGDYWLAERKAIFSELASRKKLNELRAIKIGTTFKSQKDAQEACEMDDQLLGGC